MEIIKCKLFGVKTEKYSPNGETVTYSIESNKYNLSIGGDYFHHEDTEFLKKNRHVIFGLLMNNKWPNYIEINNDTDLCKILSEHSYPKTPREKLDHLFEYLFSCQTKDGEIMYLQRFLDKENTLAKLYFQDKGECVFYLKALNEKGLIKGQFGQGIENDFVHSAYITFDGFEYYNKITEEGLKSNKCFVAMSFEADASEIRLAIKSACRKTDFDPILIDEIHYDADITINDAIIAQLKKSKFCVADFTHQKSGVYFESGFALGRGMKVIYSVQREDLKESHFDTKHFPHILYDTPEELERKLIDKIQAWIKD